MKLQFSKRHLSIDYFPEMDVPTFSVVTGLNGTGKTHLLQAIASGDVIADVAPDFKNQVRLFDWNNMVPRDEGQYDSHELIAARRTLGQQVAAQMQRVRQRFLNAAQQAGVPSDFLDLRLLATITHAELVQIVGDEETASLVGEKLQSACEAAIQRLRNGIPEQSRDLLEIIAEHKKLPSIALEPADFTEGYVPFWGRAEAFQQSFGRLFVSYRDCSLENQLKRLAHQQGAQGIAPLGDIEFISLYGMPPWDFVNEAIGAAGLDFRIDKPTPFNYDPYQPTLTKQHTGAQVSFQGLSSGEKILMSFALCLYYAEDRRQLAAYPKLLLLDEIDAPLHPSMSRRLIRIIEDVLVKKHSINVMLATHSISTVALAPESSLYEMRGENQGLHKVSKAYALNRLTVGVPTLAIAYEGRRQVFVESPIDAKVYDAVYQILKAKLGSERSLEFVATGGPTEAGSHVNTGCDTVIRLVKDLSTSGNTSVFGLLDWDGSRASSSRVIVLAEGKRDGLENVLLDPLSVVALIARSNEPKSREMIGLKSDETYLSLQTLPPDRLQALIDEVQLRVLGNLNDQRECTYSGGFKLKVANEYLAMDDHALENKLLGTFPVLNSLHKGRSGALLGFVSETILKELPQLCPVELEEAFAKLLSLPSHPSE